MTKGIFLCAFGKRGYIYSAYNLAYSIKHYNPSLQVALFCDDSIDKQLPEDKKKVFDQVIRMPQELITDPCNIKTSIYDYLPFDINLFLDVDALALQDLEPIFEDLKEGHYYTHIIGKTNINELPWVTDKGRNVKIIPTMLWAYANDIWDKYGLAEDAVLPSTNSSIQYIKKCPESKALFDKVRENYLNPIPVNQLRTPWGGGQPDELYLNIALAQTGITGQTEKEYIFLGNTLDARPLNKLKEDYLILSMFGHKDMTRARYRDWYDKLLIEYHRKDGVNHSYKSHLILADKHANNRAKLPEKYRATPAPVAVGKHTILLKFPTRSRPEKFLTCLSKALTLANNKDDIKVLVSYDADDATMTEEVIAKANAMGNVTCVKGTSHSKIHAVNRDMDKAGDWDIVVLLSDDMECEYKGWDDIIRSKYDARQDGLLHFNDGYRRQEIMTLAIMDKKYYDRFGYIYNPAYKSLFCDNEQMEVGKKLNRYRYFPEVLFRHKMAMNGFHQDALHKHTESFWDEDQDTYNKRRALNFA